MEANESEGHKQKSPLGNADFWAGVKIGLFFLVCFFLLGYTPFVSVGLGIIGGLAGSWVLLAQKHEVRDDEVRGDKVEGSEVRGDDAKLQQSPYLKLQNQESWANPFVKNDKVNEMWNKSPTVKGRDSFPRAPENEEENKNERA